MGDSSKRTESSRKAEEPSLVIATRRSQEKKNRLWGEFSGNTVTLRSDPSNSWIQTGQGLHDQRAQYLCYTPRVGGTWTFLRNTATGDQG